MHLCCKVPMQALIMEDDEFDRTETVDACCQITFSPRLKESKLRAS